MTFGLESLCGNPSYDVPRVRDCLRTCRHVLHRPVGKTAEKGRVAGWRVVWLMAARLTDGLARCRSDQWAGRAARRLSCLLRLIQVASPPPPAPRSVCDTQSWCRRQGAVLHAPDVGWAAPLSWARRSSTHAPQGDSGTGAAARPGTA